MSQVSIKQILDGKVPLGEVSVGGWIRTHRSSKSVAFIELSDGSCVKGLQLVIEASNAAYAAAAPKLSTGAAVRAGGKLVESPAKGQRFELQANSLELVGEASAEEYPLQKKDHTLEFLREHLHLRARSKTFGAIFRLRSAAALAIHEFFQLRGFFWVHTPIITTSDCEGAGKAFRVSTLDAAAPPRNSGKVDFTQDFFGEEASLTVSGQLEAEAMAEGLSLVYTFGPTFRAENSNTTRHLAEFWMIEPEMAFYDLDLNIALARDFICFIIGKVLQGCAEELEFLAAREDAPQGLLESLQAVVESRFQVVDYTDAVQILKESARGFEYPVNWGMDLQTEHERFLADEHFKGPVFVVNYPKEIKSFYMRLNEDQRTVRAMDLLVPKLGEIIGGSQREERLEQLLARMQECGLDRSKYEWYLDLRRFGSVPHAGFGLGFERFLMYVSGMQNIRDVMPFPRFPGFARCAGK